MVRIAGVNVPDDKFVSISLLNIYGIGISRSKLICNLSNVSYFIKVKDLSDKDLKLIRNNVSNFKLEGDLRRDVKLNIKRLVDISCYRGIRHKKKLPVRGQRTKTNAKTCKKFIKNIF